MRETQRTGKIMIVGVDTSDPIVEAIRRGIVAADIVQHPYRVGQLGVEMMVATLGGKLIERQVHTPLVMATPADIDTPEVQQHVCWTNCR